jgi:hypothetical protein
MAPDQLHPTVSDAFHAPLPPIDWTHYPLRPVQREGEPCVYCGNPEPQTLTEPCEGCVALEEMHAAWIAQWERPE